MMPASRSLLPASLPVSLLCLLLAGCVLNSPRGDAPDEQPMPRRDYGYGYGYPYGGGYSYRDPNFGRIDIARAIYGTAKRSCDATRQVAGLAGGRSHARVEASNRLCGDPHQGTPKVLNIAWFCNGRLHTVAVRERGTVQLSCP